MPPDEPADDTAPDATGSTATLVERIDAILHRFLDNRGQEVQAAGPELDELVRAAEGLVRSGGKRIRPLFGYWGWRCLHPDSGAEEDRSALSAVSALELLHAAALVHDDLIDGSQTRRGQPAAHVRFAEAHGAAFGSAAAILLGDQLLSWAWDLLATTEPTPATMRLFGRTAQEMMAGQYLDVLAQHEGSYSVETALRVVRFKAAKYTVERPLQFGATLGGADRTTLTALSAIGLPLGEAFQLRDDVLGVFGDPAVTGKPSGDDLREGKRTVLVTLAHAATDDSGRAVLAAGLGNPALDADGVEQLRAVVLASGALAEVERMIGERADAAQAALAEAVIRPDAREALRALAAQAITRTR